MEDVCWKFNICDPCEYDGLPLEPTTFRNINLLSQRAEGLISGAQVHEYLPKVIRSDPAENVRLIRALRKFSIKLLMRFFLISHQYDWFVLTNQFKIRF